ncbi:MAG: hypothetical protein KJ915_01460 [Candidatus Omnitrophica bacterium]|nr:hypothetical protein [Candidatus Omnitrophota bacterium]
MSKNKTFRIICIILIQALLFIDASSAGFEQYPSKVEKLDLLSPSLRISSEFFKQYFFNGTASDKNQASVADKLSPLLIQQLEKQKDLIFFSTENASYIFIQGIHTHQSDLPDEIFSQVDAVVLETGVHSYKKPSDMIV